MQPKRHFALKGTFPIETIVKKKAKFVKFSKKFLCYFSEEKNEKKMEKKIEKKYPRRRRRLGMLFFFPDACGATFFFFFVKGQ